MFRLPRNWFLAFFVIIYWWPIAAAIAVYWLIGIGAVRLLLAGVHPNMPDRTRVKQVLGLTSVASAAYAVTLQLIGIPETASLQGFAIAISVLTGGAVGTIVLRRHIARTRVHGVRHPMKPDHLSLTSWSSQPHT